MSIPAVSDRQTFDCLACTPVVSIWLGLGSNAPGRREFYLQCAVDALRKRYGRIQISPVVESAAVGGRLSDPFFNLVVKCVVDCPIEQVKTELQIIEDELHRRVSRAVVTVDIDLLIYGDFVGMKDGQQFPHPDVEKYMHVTAPLLALDPNLQLPGSDNELMNIYREQEANSTSVRFLPWSPC